MNDMEQLYQRNTQTLFALYQAIEQGDQAQAVAILEQQPELLHLPRYGKPDERSLLHLAAYHGQTDLCRWLVEQGAQLDRPAIDAGHETALCCAAFKGHVATCRWLLDAGASVDGLPDSISSPLTGAVTFNHAAVVELLLTQGADVNRLHQRLNLAPLDIARSWQFTELAALLEASGGRSVSEVQEQDNPGEPIVTFVHNTAGWVLPAVFSPTCDDPRAQLRISLIDGKDVFKLLFTVGLFEQSPMTELFLCLPADWPLPRQGLEPGSALRFPVEVLSRLARRTFEHGALREGDLVRRSDPAFADLAWPDAVDALLVIDKPWNKEPQPAPIPDDEKVWLYLLAPVKYTAKGEPQGAALTTLVERKKAASWKVLALKA